MLKTVYTSYIIGSLILTPCLAISQDIKPDSIQVAKFDIFDRLADKSNGKVSISGDNPSELIRNRFYSSRNLKGYRIRVFRDNKQNSRQQAERIKSQIQSEYSGMPVYISYKAPEWNVDVGDFRSKDEAEKIKRLLQQTYPSASLTNMVNINFPAL